MTPSQRLTRIHTLRRKIAEQERRHGRRKDKQRELELLMAQEIRAETTFFGRLWLGFCRWLIPAEGRRTA